MDIRKEDFEVYDKHLDKSNSYRPLGNGRWYNHEMYQEALTEAGQNHEPISWFEALPIYWRYAYYLAGGIVIGYLLHYVF